MSNAQTAVATRVTGTQIEQWGEREIVRELVSRMMMFHPAAQEVGEPGMLAAAQLAVMVGASPLPGLNEIHIWKDRKGVHVNPGINYYRRRAREVGGGVRWTGGDGKPRPMTLTEKQTYGIAENQPAAICTAMRADDFDKYWTMGVRFPEIETISSVTGIAIAGEGEAKNGRPAVWTAIKRAETDILRQLYPNLEQPEDTTDQARVAIRRMDGLGATDEGGPDWDASTVLYGDPVADEFIDADPETGEIVDQEPEQGPELPTNGNAPTLPLPDAWAHLAELEEDPDLDALQWRELSTAACNDLGYNHPRHVSSAMKQELGPDWHKIVTKTQAWHLLKERKEQGE